MSSNIPRVIHLNMEEDPLSTLHRCGGYYECPVNLAGTRLGPLVGYAGKDSSGRNYVGDIYANFAKAEVYPTVLQSFAIQVHKKIPAALLDEIDVFCAAPLGGMAFAQQLALHSFRRYAFAEKKPSRPQKMASAKSPNSSSGVTKSQ